MKIFPSALLLACAVALTPQALADCRDIVASTVAEMRAGAAEWNEDMERLARAAAGAACVKAGGDAAAPAHIREQAVRPEGSVQQAPAQAAPVAAAADESGDGNKDKEEEAWSPFKDIKFNEVTASPNKKPYERRRSVNEPDESED